MIHSCNIEQHSYCEFSSKETRIYSGTALCQHYIKVLQSGYNKLISFSPHSHSFTNSKFLFVCLFLYMSPRKNKVVIYGGNHKLKYLKYLTKCLFIYFVFF